MSEANFAHRPAIYEGAKLRRELADGRYKALLRQAADNDRHFEDLRELARNGDPVAAQQYAEAEQQHYGPPSDPGSCRTPPVASEHAD